MLKQTYQRREPSDQTSNVSGRQSRSNFYAVPEPSITPGTITRCARCGAAFESDAQFCVNCGLKIAFATHKWFKAQPWLAPRLWAEIMDRLFPFVIALLIFMPMILLGVNGFFWTWISITFLWHLFRDWSPNRRSLGKRCFRLRVVSENGLKQCAWWRVIARRMLSALSQVAYCIAITSFIVSLLPSNEIPWPWPLFVPHAKTLLLLAFGYDFVSLASILISDGGYRIEDFILRTRVIREAAYKRDRVKCGNCGALVLKSDTYCGRCGYRNAPKIKIRPVD